MGEDPGQRLAWEIAAHRRVEWLAEPVQQDGPVRCVDDVTVGTHIVVFAGVGFDEPQLGQDDRYAAQALDEADLFGDRCGEVGKNII